MRYLFWALLMLLPACKKSPEEVARLRIEGQIKEMSVVLETYEKKIAAAGNDPGLRSRLINDQALLKSRIDRLKEMVSQHEKH